VCSNKSEATSTLFGRLMAREVCAEYGRHANGLALCPAPWRMRSRDGRTLTIIHENERCCVDGRFVLWVEKRRGLPQQFALFSPFPHTLIRVRTFPWYISSIRIHISHFGASHKAPMSRQQRQLHYGMRIPAGHMYPCVICALMADVRHGGDIHLLFAHPLGKPCHIKLSGDRKVWLPGSRIGFKDFSGKGYIGV